MCVIIGKFIGTCKSGCRDRILLASLRYCSALHFNNFMRMFKTYTLVDRALLSMNNVFVIK